TAALRPATAALRPATAALRPATAALRPATAALRPATAALRPATAALRPATAEQYRDREGAGGCWLALAVCYDGLVGGTARGLPVPFDEKTSSTRGTKPERPVRGKTLSWGELEGQIEAASRLAWPGRSESLPDARAVR